MRLSIELLAIRIGNLFETISNKLFGGVSCAPNETKWN